MPEQFQHQASPSAVEFIRDPVCAIIFEPKDSTPSHVYGGREYLFCGLPCRDEFAANPDAYMTAKDPLCGTNIAHDSAKYMVKHKEQSYYFCCKNCAVTFESDPENHLGDRLKTGR